MVSGCHIVRYVQQTDVYSNNSTILAPECLFGVAPLASPSLEELAQKIKDDKPIEVSREVCKPSNYHSLYPF